MIIEKICYKFNIAYGEITTACDGMDAIRMETYKDTSFSSKTKHFYILSAVDAMLEQSPIQWKYCHVKGNQDYQVDPLDRWESLNVKRTTAANQRWDQYQDNTRNTTRHKLEHEIWRLYYNFLISSTGKQNTDTEKNYQQYF